MWIRTQNKQRIINSDQIIDIFVDKTGTKIMAETTRDGDFFTLGEYKDRDTCLKILEHILMAIGRAKAPGITMPLGGDVESWEKAVEDITNAYIASDFRIK